MKQLSFLDIVPPKEREELTPSVWECVDSCANFTNIDKAGGRDYFPGTRTPRCTHCYEENAFKSKVINNVWVTKCRFYEPREETKT